MRFLGIIFYASVLTLIGLALVVFSLNQLEPQALSDVLVSLQGSASTRFIIGLSGTLLILISLRFAQLILGRFQQEKTIAFPTSTGQVTIALSAVEDLVRRLAGVLPEIKELRPNVRATKKGSIVVDLRVVLKSETNIPELTSRLQEIARSKIQEVLGIEEQIIIRIHVAKIIGLEERDRKRREAEKEEPTVPFHGYGRV
ncbi:MAG: alkaline shock response membrane anchor protein AmaP [Candidatus Omnitrophota bacterium]